MNVHYVDENRVSIEFDLNNHIEAELFRLVEMTKGHPLLKVVLLKGMKADMTFHINNGRVLDYGPFVKQIP